MHMLQQKMSSAMSGRDHIKERPLLAYQRGGEQQEGVAGNFIFYLVAGSSPSSLNSADCAEGDDIRTQLIMKPSCSLSLILFLLFREIFFHPIY